MFQSTHTVAHKKIYRQCDVNLFPFLSESEAPNHFTFKTSNGAETSSVQNVTTNSTSNRNTNNESSHTILNRHKCTRCKKSFRFKYLLTLHMKAHTKHEKELQNCKNIKSFDNNGRLPKYRRMHTQIYSWTCTLCSKKINQRQIKLHLYYHSGKYKYACNICQIGYSIYHSYYSHMKTVHNEIHRLPAECTECSKLFTKPQDFKMHLRYHSDQVKHKCDSCEKGFITTYSFRKHMSVTHNKKVTTQSKHVCTQCVPIRDLMNDSKLQLHLRYHSGDYKYSCKQCELGYKKYSNYRLHMKNSHNETIESNIYKCKHCSKIFSLQDQLEMHLRYHSDQFKYKCSFCEKGYISEMSYQDHMKRIHKIIERIENRYQCKYCSMVFTNINQYHSHLRNKHNEIEDLGFKCKHCERKFETYYLLKGHLRYHSGDYEYFCRHCEIGYSGRMAALSFKKHMMQTHNEAVNVKSKLACTQCNPIKEFKRTDDLERHLRFHTGDYIYACKKCETTFTNSSCGQVSYRNHMKTVHDETVHIDIEDKYKCKECSKSYSGTVDFKLHKNYHSGRYRFACTYCELGYSTKMKTKFISHMKKQHNEQQI